MTCASTAPVLRLFGCRVLLALVLAASALAAEDRLPRAGIPGESRAAAERLADARQHIAQRNWGEAVRELSALLEKPGTLVPLSPEHSVRAARLAQHLLAKLPPEALALYRNRADVQAGQWLEQGLAARDEQLLRRVVEEAFCSRPAEKALDALGDLAFERGDYDLALHWWQLLVPAPGSKPEDAGEMSLAFPDPRTDRARIRAKQLLARVWQSMPFRKPGEITPDLAARLEGYTKEHGTAEGTLAGRTGRYAEILRALAARKDLEGWSDPDWPTYGGDAGRGRVLPAPDDILDRLSRLCRRPTWRIDLLTRTAREETSGWPLGATRSARWGRDLGCFPVLAGSQLLFADTHHVAGCDLRTGRVRDRYEAPDARPVGKPERDDPIAKPGVKSEPPAPRCTLTVAGDWVYVRQGEPVVAAPRGGNGRRDPGDSSVVCLPLQPDAGPQRARWTLKANPQEHGAFEGTPLVHGGLLYVAATRLTGERATTAIHCYPADTPTAPTARWIVDVCESRDPAPPRTLQHLLTRAGPYLIYASQAGALVALDPETGQRVWAVRYPGSPRENRAALPGSEKTQPPVDLAPCIAAGERVYAAPLDDERLLCLDAATGRLLWQREGIQAVHLLGIGRGKLIFTTPTGLRAVSADTGADTGGWIVPDAGRLPPYGRGLLLGDLVLWPTVRGVFAVRQEDGRQADNPTLLHAVPPGNLLYARGCLVVAERTQHAHNEEPVLCTLTIFAPGAAAVEAGERRLGRAPGPRAWLDLACAQADAGDERAARASLARAEALTAALPAALQRDARTQLRAERLHLLEQALASAIAANKEEEALSLLAEALQDDNPGGPRVRALMRCATACEQHGKAAAAAGLWLTLLRDGSRRGLLVSDADARPRLAGELAAQRLRRLPRQGEARRYLDEAAREGRLEDVAALAWADPQGTVLRELLARQEQAGNPAATAEAARLVLAHGAKTDAARARLALARAYEQQQCFAAARAEWQRLAAAAGDGTIAELDPARPARTVIAARLREAPYTSTTDAPCAALLLRAWGVPLDPGEQLLPLADDLAAPGPDLIVSTVPAEAQRPASLRCRAARDGRQCWETALPFRPEWARRHADLLLACGSHGSAALRQQDGHVVWQITSPAGLDAFRLAAGRLFLREGTGRLLALDAAGGRLLWSWELPGAGLRLPWPEGVVFPEYHAGPDTLLVASAGRLRLLEAATGRVLRESAGPADPSPVRPLPLDAASVAVVSDGNAVGRIDVHTGQARWTWQPRGRSILSGLPVTLLGSTEALFAVVPLNVGCRLEKIDPGSGTSLWEEPPFLRSSGADASRWASDRQAVYTIDQGVLTGRAATDGRTLWRQVLPAAAVDWRLATCDGAVLAWPAAVREATFGLRWLGASLEWRGCAYRNGAAAPDLPLLVFDAATGRLLQRLNFDAGPPGRPFRTAARPLTLAPGLVWQTGTMPADFMVQRIPGGLVVAAGGRLWGLR